MKFLIQPDVSGNEEVRDKSENTSLTSYHLIHKVDILTNSCPFTRPANTEKNKHVIFQILHFHHDQSFLI